ncbi:D-inositol-3-phosphate glycosyltransferase [soil metagenome]
MTTDVRRVAMVSMHTSPVAPAGAADAGGMNIVLVQTALQLAARGVEVDLLTRASGEPHATLLAPGVTLHEIPAGPRRAVAKGQLMEYADEFGEGVARLTGRDTPHYDVIHAHYWLSGIATLPVALELGIPFVQSFHTLGAMKNRSLAPGDAPEPETRLRVETYLANQADAIVAGSSAEVTALIDEVRAPADRLWVVPPGVDAAMFTPTRRSAAAAVRERLGVAAGRAIVTVVGRVQPLKGQDLAIRALAAMTGQRPLLVIVGDPTPGGERYVDELHALVASLGVQADVRFVGRVDREGIADLLAASALTLVPSHSETFGLVALESAASGTPVIGSRSTGLVESIADGQSGLLLGSRDPADWAAGISGLLGAPARLLELSSHARDHAEKFSWATAAASLLGIYASLKR